MSRIARIPVPVPRGVEVRLETDRVQAKGGKGELEMKLHRLVQVRQEGDALRVAAREDAAEARELSEIMGSTRALLNNMVQGVSHGFERRLLLNGVGYRAALSGKTLNLTLGFSHPVRYSLPAGISAELPSQTEIILRGADKQLLGQTAAEIRAFRPPEPYKGKGIRHADEQLRLKEAKKK